MDEAMELDFSEVESAAKVMPGGLFIYLADEGEQVLYVNDVVLDIFGCRNREEFDTLTGNTFSGMVHPEDLSHVKSSISQQIHEDGRKFDQVEYRIIRKDGSICWVDDFGRLLQTKDYGNVFCVFIQDITEKKRMQEESRRMELALEKERQVVETKDEFLFRVSHDIRTPMNAIMGFTDLAMRHMDEPEKLRDYLGKVDEANRHLLTLIDDLLEAGQLQTGTFELKPEVCELREQLQIVLDMMAVQAEKKGVALQSDIAINEGRVIVDAHCLRRVLSNLMDNAIKFTPKGGLVTLSAEEGKRSGSGYRRYVFRIADTGIGMSEEFMQRMFGSFEQENTSTKSGIKGVGLGLSISKSLIDMMGGSMEAESEKGKGSVFIVNLPMKMTDGQALARDSVQTGSEMVQGDNRRILLVEDIEINRLLAENILQEAGFLVESAEDGSDAVELVKHSPEGFFDLILMDIQMPVMNGYEATRLIRGIGRGDTDRMPIIALSANAREEDKRKSIESGMNSHVAKPFDVAHLLETIREHLESHRGRQSS